LSLEACFLLDGACPRISTITATPSSKIDKKIDESGDCALCCKVLGIENLDKHGNFLLGMGMLNSGLYVCNQDI
jgi:hypothetical protein